MLSFGHMFAQSLVTLRVEGASCSRMPYASYGRSDILHRFRIPTQAIVVLPRQGGIQEVRWISAMSYEALQNPESPSTSIRTT